jgi:hypothetical protein
MKKVAITAVAAASILMLISVIGYALNWPKPWRYIANAQEYYFNSQLRTQIESGIQKIRLKNLTTFEWSTVCSFQSYTLPSREDMRKNGNVLQGVTLRNSVPDINDDGEWALLFKDDATNSGYVIEVTDYTFSRRHKIEECYSNPHFTLVDEPVENKPDAETYKSLVFSN